jgi:ring-1,2-phenylacetyl-CoA epoxidase subunit PaaE
MAGPRFHRLAIADVRRETAEAVSLAFSVPEALTRDYAFEPGQYLTLKARIGAEEVRRSYSICAGPQDGELRIAVKRVEGGLFSPWAAETFAVGHEIDVMTPVGRFGAAVARPGARLSLGIAAGSGITPILSILKAVLAADPANRFVLIYGNRNARGILFGEALAELKDRYLSRLSIFHAEKLRLLLRHLVPVSAVAEAFVCGPAELNATTEQLLRELGMAPEAIHVERFVSEAGGKPRVRPPAPAAAPEHATLVRIIADGKSRDVPVMPDETILDAALGAGLDLPYACKGGMCTTCRAKAIAGRVRMEVNYSLEPWETGKGFVLTCQSHPEGLGVVVDFDAV